MKEGLPGVIGLGWWMLMKPVRLHRRLKALGVEPNARPWVPWDQGGVARAYLLRMVALLVLGNLVPLLVFYPLVLLGMQVDWWRVVVGVAFGLAVGVTGGAIGGVAGGAAGGVAVGLAMAVTVGIAFGASTPLFDRVEKGLAVCTAFTVALTVVSRSVYGVALGVPVVVARGVSICLAVGAGAATWVAMASAMRVGVAPAATVGLAGGVFVALAFSLQFFRLPLTVLEIPTQFLLYGFARSGRASLHLVPVLHHDLSYIPHPFLADHILLGADQQPDIAREVLEACAIAPGQRKAGQRALARLQARSLQRLATNQEWASLSELSGPWLPGVEGASPALLSFREVARYAAAASAHTNPRHQLQQLDQARLRLTSAENALLGASALESTALIPVLARWRAILDAQASAVQQAAQATLPNPFRAGRPLSPDEGAETFRGRAPIAQRIGQLLADPSQHPTLVLLGPRRCGKTSLLKMLPVLLPDALVVFIDLQDNPTDSPRAFFQAIAKQAREAAQRDRRFSVPALPDGPPFEAASAWLDALERAAGSHRVLLCFDEFERLETLFPGDRAELLKLMGLLRGIAQHRRAVRLLVAGVAPFDELDLMWSDHFIGAHELRVEHLDPETSVGLLTGPADDFPPDTIPRDVAAEISRRADGQPYLLQLYGQHLVLRLDNTRRRAATLDDLDPVEEELLSTGASYFRFTFSDCTPDRQALLRRLAEGEAVALSRQDQRWLQRRAIVTAEGRIRVPVFARWIRDVAE